MKIVQINICDNGSTGKIMLDIMSSLDSSIQSTAYVSLKYSNNDKIKLIHTRNGYRLHKFFAMYLGLDEYGSYFETKKLIKELNKIKPDIIHLHNIHSYSINYLLLFDYIKKNNIKVVWTLHDCWAFTGGCSHFELNNCHKWQTKCNKCDYLQSAGVLTNINRINKLYEKKKEAFTGVKDLTIVTPSKWLANLVGESFLGEYPIKVINNGINFDYFKHVDNHTFDNILDRSKKILLAVASPFGERKGFSDYIKLSKILPREYQIVMVGLTDEQIKSLPDNVIGIKRTNNQVELAELYSIAYAFVNFTYEEVLGMVNIEALACGTPIICYRTGGAVEMLNEYNACIIDKGDYESTIKCLDSIEALRQNSVKYINDVKNNFSKETMTKNYLETYGI